jgi:hypothetical protein
MVPGWLKTWLRRRDIDAAIAGEPPAWRFTSVPADRLFDYEQDLRHTIGTIRAIGATPLVMTHANVFMAAGGDSAQLTAWGRFYPRATTQAIAAFDSAAVSVTLRAARDSGAIAVDLANTVRALPDGVAPRLFGDYAHFSDTGSAVVASALRAALTPMIDQRCGRPAVMTRLFEETGSAPRLTPAAIPAMPTR